jgi:hypothetical protein
MDVDLEHLIRLQQTDTFIENARRRVADHPNLITALDARLASARENVGGAKSRLADNQASRRLVEKDLSAIQIRLGKYKDQLMEVKTNKEYQAMLKEIEAAQTEVRRFEDRILEHMIEADDLASRLKEAEARLAADEAAVAAERQQLEAETAALQRQLAETASVRERLVSETPPALLASYDTVRARRGVAVVEVKGEYCSACHVRMRPQRANELRRNNAIVQCDSCQRFLYFPPQSAAAGEGPA